MSKTPDKEKTKRLLKNLLPMGIILAINIALMILFYFLFSQSIVALFPRLIVSICAPPAVIALVSGIYMLVSSIDKSDKT